MSGHKFFSWFYLLFSSLLLDKPRLKINTFYIARIMHISLSDIQVVPKNAQIEIVESGQYLIEKKRILFELERRSIFIGRPLNNFFIHISLIQNLAIVCKL